jgi:hypothetical protein
MASTYENDLRLEEMATGENSGSWGTKTNTNLELIADAFSYGTETIANADTTITIADGAADAARSLALKINSSEDLTTTRVVTLAPNTTSKVWIIENNTSGNQELTLSAGSGSNVSLPNGVTKIIATDGVGSGSSVTEIYTNLDNLTIDDVLSIADGTAALPSLTNTGDTNTGIYFPGDNQFAITNNGTQSLFINASGDVGIGTETIGISSGRRFHIFDDSSDTILRVETQTTGSDARLELISDNTGTSQLRYGDQDDPDVGFINYDHSSNAMNFATNGASRVTINSSGDLDVEGDITAHSTAAGARIMVRADNDGATDGPIIDLYRNSASPLADDDVGQIYFSGENSTDAKVQYATIEAYIETPDAGSEDGRLRILISSGGTSNMSYIDLDASQGGADGRILFNAGGSDIDFQVETDTDPYALYVDGSADKIGIGTNVPEDKLHVEGRLRLDSTVPTIRFEETDTTDENWEIVVNSGTLKFRENNDAFNLPTSRMDMLQGGDIRIGTDLDVDHNGVVQIATANNNTQLSLVSTDADAIVGPDLKLLRASASPADGDNTGRIRFVAYDSEGTEQTFARISTSAATVLDTDEDGVLEFDVVKDGSVDSRLLFNASNTIFNNDQKDVDFRVESVNKTYALMVNAGNDRVGMGTGTPSTPLHIVDSGTGGLVTLEVADGANNDVAPELTLYRNYTTPADGDVGGGIEFNLNDSGGNNTTFARIYGAANDVTNGTEDGALYFHVRNDGTLTEKVRINQGGVGIGTTDVDAGFDLQVQGSSKFSKTNNDVCVLLESTDGDANDGPLMVLDRNSGSPADNDNLGKTIYRGRNDAAEEVDYVTIRAEARTVADGGEDGRFQMNVIKDGTNVSVLDIDMDGTSNEIVFNEGGNEIDFRVEGQGSASLIRTRASTDTVMMETSATITTGPTLAVHQGASNITAEFVRGSSTGTATIVNMYSDNGGANTLQHHFEANGDLEIQGTLTEASDERIKQDIVDSGSQWDDIKAIQVRKYRKIWDVEQYGDDADVLLGVVAQELEASGMGGLVKTRVNEEDPDDDLKSVKYSVLYMKAIKALQEAMVRIETLEAKVTALENS